jgi:hypothetical protein
MLVHKLRRCQYGSPLRVLNELEDMAPRYHMVILIVALEIVLLSSFILMAESDHVEYRVPALEFFRPTVFQFCSL